MKRANYSHIRVGVFLSFLSGALDAYTYLRQGGVFAGMQTGNIILMLIRLSQGAFSEVIPYLVSIIMFCLGTFLAKAIQDLAKHRSRHHSGTLILLYEMVLLCLASIFESDSPSLLVTSIIALAAAAQFLEFRSLKEYSYANNMMTGNLRNFISALYDAWILKERKAEEKAHAVGRVIVSFMLGVLVSALMASHIRAYSIWLLAFGLMVVIGLAHFQPNLIEDMD